MPKNVTGGYLIMFLQVLINKSVNMPKYYSEIHLKISKSICIIMKLTMYFIHKVHTKNIASVNNVNSKRSAYLIMLRVEVAVLCDEAASSSTSFTFGKKKEDTEG